jgi:flagellar protein FlaG
MTARWLTGQLPVGRITSAAPAVAQPTQASVAVTQEVSRAVDRIQNFVGARARELDFYIDEPTGQTVITVRDRETDQVIRQIPSEEILAVAERINEMQQAGLLMQGKA